MYHPLFTVWGVYLTETPWIGTPKTRQPDRKRHHTETTPPHNRQTGVKTVPCPKLCLRAVKTTFKHFKFGFIAQLYAWSWSKGCFCLEHRGIILFHIVFKRKSPNAYTYKTRFSNEWLFVFGSYSVLTINASDTLSKLRQFAVLFGSGFNAFTWIHLPLMICTSSY